MKLKTQDILFIGIGLLLIFNRAIPIDYSSLWQMGTLSLVYIAIRILPSKYYPILFLLICLLGAAESCIAILQSFHYLESNHHAFPVTGTFGNPGPLGGFLAISLIVSISLFCKSRERKKFYYRIFYIALAAFIGYGLILTNSRAGWLAALIGFLFLFSHYYPLSHRKKILVCLFVSVFVVAIYFLKEDSANGRLFIWLNTWEIIKDYPILGTGSGGWLANYMHYQADYYIQHPDSAYVTLADNVFYPYNEFLHFMAEQGTIGLLCLLFLFHTLFTKKNNYEKEKQAALMSFIVFACFSYPANVFSLQILFICIIGTIQSRDLNIKISRKIYCTSVGFITLCLFIVSGWSLHFYNETFSRIKTAKNYVDISLLNTQLPFFRYNPQLMHYYSQLCIHHKYSIDNTMQILQATSLIVPTCELYCDMGDIWLSKNNPVQAETYYRTAAAMLPCRLTPNYKLFLLYANQENREAAINIGKRILNQPIKKESTKTLRMKAEVIQYIRETNNSSN